MPSTPISLPPSPPPYPADIFHLISDDEFHLLQHKATTLTYLFLTLEELSRMRMARFERGMEPNAMLEMSIRAQSAGGREHRRIRYSRQLSGTLREITVGR